MKRGSAPVFVIVDNNIVEISREATDKVMPAPRHEVTLTGRIEEGNLVSVETISSMTM